MEDLKCIKQSKQIYLNSGSTKCTNRQNYSKKSFDKSKEFDSKKIEQREAEIYSELIGVKNN